MYPHVEKARALSFTLNKSALQMNKNYNLKPETFEDGRNYFVFWTYASKLLLSINIHNLLSVAVTKNVMLVICKGKRFIHLKVLEAQHSSITLLTLVKAHYCVSSH